MIQIKQGFEKDHPSIELVTSRRHPVTRGRRRHCFILRVHEPKRLGTCGQGHVKSEKGVELETCK